MTTDQSVRSQFLKLEHHSPIFKSYERAPRRMRCPLFLGTLTILIAGLLRTAAATPTADSGDTMLTAKSLLQNLPLTFEGNQGQFDSSTRFLARGPGYALRLGDTETALVLHKRIPAAATKRDGSDSRSRKTDTKRGSHSISFLSMKLIGSNPRASIEGLEALPGTLNYFIGDDPGRWRADLRGFAKVRYAGVYPGIDLIYYGNQRKLEYDFVIQPGGRPERIKFAFEGADSLTIAENGDLVASVDDSEVRWLKPFAYQVENGMTNEVSSRYILQGRNHIGFEVGTYDIAKPLIIDPILVYGTFYGGTDVESAPVYNDSGIYVALDPNRNAYIAGATLSTDLVVTSAYRTTNSGPFDVFVAKINPSGSNLVYATYLGGRSNDVVHGLAVDTSGNAYLVGQTDSINFPVNNAYQSANAGYADVFVSKLGPSGNTLPYSTYIGGPDDDIGNAIAVDNSGNAVITGQTYSTFPTGPSSNRYPLQNPFQSNPGSQSNSNPDAFISKLNTLLSGSSSFIYSSFLGGYTDETGAGITLDAAGNAYAVGEVSSYTYDANGLAISDFPTTANALQRFFNLGDTNAFGSLDGFLCKVSSSGAKLYCTYIGGTLYDSAIAVALDAATNIYVTGWTMSSDLPVTNAAQASLGGGELAFTTDAFITKLSSSGSTILYSTYFGGYVNEQGWGIAVDPAGYVYLTGFTTSDDMPVTGGTLQPTNSGAGGGFAAKFNSSAIGPASLIFSTYLSGNGLDLANGIAVDAAGNFYVSGSSDSTSGFPITAGSVQTTNRGEGDAFLIKLESPVDLSTSLVATNAAVLTGSNFTYRIFANNNGRIQFSSVVVSNLLPAQLQLVSASATVGNLATNASSVIWTLGVFGSNATASATITVKALTPGNITNTAIITSTETAAGGEPNTNNNYSPVPIYVQGFTDVTLNTSASPNPVLAWGAMTYSLGVTNKGPSIASQVLVTNTLPPGSFFDSAITTRGGVTNYSGVVVATVGTLAVGDGAIITLNAFAPSTLGPVTNRAVAVSADVDTLPGNNATTNVTTVLTSGSLGIVDHLRSPNPVLVGSNVTHTIIVTNYGPYSAGNSVLTDPIPPGSAFVSAQSTPNYSFNTNGGIVTFNLGTFTNGAGAVITIVLRPTAAGLLTNTATVSSSADPYLPDNSATIVTTVNVNPALAPPALNIAVAGNNALLFWPTGAVGYELQFAPRLVTTGTNTWSYLLNKSPVGAFYYVTNPLTPSNRVYRLIK